MKDELGGKIMTEFVALKPKTYSYLTDDCEEEGTKKCVIKRRLKGERKIFFGYVILSHFQLIYMQRKNISFLYGS